MRLFLKSFAAAMIGLACTSLVSAQAAPACLKGRELTNAMINSINAIPGKPDETKAYAILFWKRATYQVYDQPEVMSQLSRCTYPAGSCGLPQDISNTRFGKLIDYKNDLQAFKNGRISVEPRSPLDAPFPDDSMLKWAEGVLGCDATDYVQVPVQQPAEDPKWAGYDAARAAGGDQFYQWWRKHYEMKHSSHALELCRKFGSSSYECSLVGEWTYLKTGTNPYVGGNATFNSQYSDYGNNPANAGYDRPTRGPEYEKTVREMRCYNQGDGTEKCFYD